MSEECIFCKISRGEIPSERIYENEEFFSIFDIDQSHPGHALVISKKHYETTFDLPKELGVYLLDCITETAKKLKEKYDAEGFNIINNNSKVAGQVIPHVHFHILPRKQGDSPAKIY